MDPKSQRLYSHNIRTDFYEKLRTRKRSLKLKLGLLGVKNGTVVTKDINKTMSQILSTKFHTETIKGI